MSIDDFSRTRTREFNQPESHEVVSSITLQVRVLHVHSGNIFGGIETVLLTQARYQHRCPSLEFEFALCFDGRLRDELVATGATVHDLGPVKLRDPLAVRRARKKLEQLLLTEKFDAVVTHSCWTQAAFGPTLQSAGAPLVFYLHAPPDGRHWLERLAKRTPPDLILCNSHYTADSVSTLYPNVRAEVVYCPVPSRQVTSSSSRNAKRAELQTSENAIVVVQVGRMERWKGYELHLKALANLNEMPDWICWIVGGAQRPSERKFVAELESLAQQLGIAERVRFLGQRDDVGDLLGAADIFCQPNRVGEPFGISFIEALYAGLPVITSDIGAAREVVDETCGIRVAAGDVDAVTEALRRLMENRDLRAQLGRRGPSRAAQLCDPKVQLDKFQSSVNSVNHRRQAIA